MVVVAVMVVVIFRRNVEVMGRFFFFYINDVAYSLEYSDNFEHSVKNRLRITQCPSAILNELVCLTFLY